MDEVKQEQKKQSRTFSVILYPDTDTYNTEEVLAACCEYFTDWAYILHNKDTLEDGSLKKPHYHVVGRLAGSRTPQAVANRIGVPSNYVDCKKGYTFKKGLRYLLHLDDPDKAQYDRSDICCSGDFSGYFSRGDESACFSMIYSRIMTENITDTAVLIPWLIEENLIDVYRRNFFVFKDIMRFNFNQIHGK